MNKELEMMLLIRRSKSNKIKGIDWSVDNLDVLNAHAKKAGRKHAGLQQRFYDESNY